MINISQKFDSNQTQKCRFIDVNIQKLEVYRNLYVQSSCKLLFVQGSWWLFAPSCLDAQAGKPQGSKMLAIKNRHSLLPGTGNVHNQIPLIPNLPAKHDEFTLKERTSNPLSHLAIWTMIIHQPRSHCVVEIPLFLWQVANFMCHVYHPWLGMVNIPPMYLWWFFWGVVSLWHCFTHINEPSPSHHHQTWDDLSTVRTSRCTRYNGRTRRCRGNAPGVRKWMENGSISLASLHWDTWATWQKSPKN